MVKSSIKKGKTSFCQPLCNSNKEVSVTFRTRVTGPTMASRICETLGSLLLYPPPPAKWVFFFAPSRRACHIFQKT